MVQSGPDGRVRQLARLLPRLHPKVNDHPSKISLSGTPGVHSSGTCGGAMVRVGQFVVLTILLSSISAFDRPARPVFRPLRRQEPDWPGVRCQPAVDERPRYLLPSARSNAYWKAATSC